MVPAPGLSDEELIRIGYGTKKHPHVAVHFDLFPHVYFQDTTWRVGMSIDKRGGKVCQDMEQAQAYALEQFDVLEKEELAKLSRFKEMIPHAVAAPMDNENKGGW